jgi:thiamine-monophosphate kinase
MSFDMPGEFDLIRWIRQTCRPRPHVPVGPGDDLAVVKWNASDLLIVGVDQVLDGRHFDSKVHSPTDVGRKAMNRNLSDCAAMACLPAVAVCTVALPRDRSIDYAKELMTGMTRAGDAFDCPVVGGDTASWDGPPVVTVTILGKSEGIEPVRRSGAKAGHGLYVTGPLGGSILGRHLTFSPRVELAREPRRRVPRVVDDRPVRRPVARRAAPVRRVERRRDHRRPRPCRSTLTSRGCPRRRRPRSTTR